MSILVPDLSRPSAEISGPSPVISPLPTGPTLTNGIPQSDSMPYAASYPHGPNITAGIIQSNALPYAVSNPLGENPWDAQARIEQEKRAKDFTTRSQNLENVVSDPDTFFKGKNLTSIAATDEEARAAVINNAFLRLHSGIKGAPPAFGVQRDLLRAMVARDQFGGKGAESEEEFHAQIVGKYKTTKEKRDVLTKLKTESYAQVVMGKATNSPTADAWRETRAKLQAMPGYSKDDEPDYLEAFHEIRKERDTAMQTFAEPLQTVFGAFRAKGNVRDAAFTAYDTMPDADRKPFMAALVLASERLKPEEKAEFWANMNKQFMRDLDSTGNNLVDFVKTNEDKFADVSFDMRDPTPPFYPSEMVRREQTVRQSKAAADDYRKKADFAADVAAVNQSTYDPIKYLSKDSDDILSMRTLEKSLYSMPGAVASSLIAAVPGVGMPAFYAMTQESAYQQYRQEWEAQGMSYEEASRKAELLAPFGAVPQMLMERIQIGVLKGKLPVFENALETLNKKFGSLAPQAVIRFGTGMAVESQTEVWQNRTPAVVQYLARALGMDVPEKQWLNGKDGILDGYWTESAGMLVTMFPLVLTGTVRGLGSDYQRVKKFRESSVKELDAAGGKDSEETLEKVKSGNLVEANAAIDEFMSDLDPRSEKAKAAVEELKAQQAVQRDAYAAAQATGMVPIIDQERLPDGTFNYTVCDAESGEVVGEAKDRMGAIRISTAHSAFLGDQNADKIAYFASMLEAGEDVANSNPDNGVQRYELGKYFTEETAAAESPDSIDQFHAQATVDEQIHGGSGDRARSALGQHKEELRGGVRYYLNRFFGGASITTIVHEMGHTVMGKMEAAGHITHEEKIAMVRGVNQLMLGKRTRTGGKKDARTLSVELLPSGVADADITPSMLNEALNRILESEVVRTRKTAKGEKAIPLSPGVITRNLTALAKTVSPQTVEKFRGFLESVRGLFGLTVTRATIIQKALRGGTLDRAGYEAMIDKLTGRDLQAEHNAAVNQEVLDIMGVDRAGSGNLESTDYRAQAEELGIDMPFSLSQGQSVNPFGAQESFSKAVDSILDGSYDMTKPVQMGGTPLAFQLAGANSLPVSMSPSVVKKATEGKHDLPRELLKKVISSMHDPVFIFDSETVPDAMTAILDLTHFGESILVAVHLDKKQAQHEVNLVASIYDKSNPRALEGWIKNGSLRYIHTQKGREWFRSRGLQLPKEGTPRGKSNLRTEADLVKRMGDTAFSLAPSSMVAGVMNSLGTIRNPRLRILSYKKLRSKLGELKDLYLRIELMQGIREDEKTIKKEAAMREALRAEEIKEEIMRKYEANLPMGEVDAIRKRPIHEYLSDPIERRKGKLMSKAVALRKHPELFTRSGTHGYEGSENALRSMFGGDLTPDMAATLLYGEGLIQNPTPDNLWRGLAKEQDYQEVLALAVRGARTQAREEINAWLKTKQKSNEAANPVQEEILKALVVYDAILSIVPPAVRGRISGHTPLARLADNESRMHFLQRGVHRMATTMEKHFKMEYTKNFLRLLRQAVPKRDKPGEVPVGKYGPEVHDIFKEIRQVYTMKPAEVDSRIQYYEGQLNDSENTDHKDYDPTGEKPAFYELMIRMIEMTGAWSTKDAAEREDAVIQMSNLLQHGYMKAIVDILKRKERRAKDLNELITSTGKTGNATVIDENRHKKTKAAERVKTLIKSLKSFEQQLNTIFGGAQDVVRKWADQERWAWERYADMTNARAEALARVYENIAGGELKGRLLTFELKQPKHTITNGTDAARILSEHEMITATLMWRQPDGQRHMRGNKFSTWHYYQDFIDEIESKLSPEAKIVREHLIESYGQEYDRLNAVYRQLYGINLPKNEFYSPLAVIAQKVNTAQTNDPNAPAIQESGWTPKSLRTRATDAIAQPDFLDAAVHYMAHVKQIEHWISYAPVTQDMQQIFSKRDLRNAMLEKATEEDVNILMGWIDSFSKGGNRDAAQHIAYNQEFNQALSRNAYMVLAAKIGTVLMQVTNTWAIRAKMPLHAFLPRLVKLYTGRLSFKKALQTEFIQRRMKNFPPVIQQALDGLANVEPGYITHKMEQAFEVIGTSDAYATAGGYAIGYDYFLSRYLKAGIPQAEAEALAHAEAEVAVDNLNQPIRPGAKSYYEVRNTSPQAKVGWQFASESRKGLAHMMFTVADPNASAIEKYRAIERLWIWSSLPSALISTMMRDLMDGDDDEVFDEKNLDPLTLGLRILAGPLNGLPFIGDAIEGALFAAAGQYTPDGNTFAPISNLPRSVGTLWSMAPVFGDEDFDLDKAIKAAEGIAHAGGLVNKKAATAKVVIQAIRQVVGGAETAYHTVKNATK